MAVVRQLLARVGADILDGVAQALACVAIGVHIFVFHARWWFNPLLVAILLMALGGEAFGGDSAAARQVEIVTVVLYLTVRFGVRPAWRRVKPQRACEHRRNPELARSGDSLLIIAVEQGTVHVPPQLHMALRKDLATGELRIIVAQLRKVVDELSEREYTAAGHE